MRLPSTTSISKKNDFVTVAMVVVVLNLVTVALFWEEVLMHARLCI